ncbi:MAG: DinB family protein [Planctomycetota bacterium]
MHTAASLMDLQRRTHHSLKGVLDHARTAPSDVIHRTLEAIGPGTIAQKLQHVISAERYWIGVVNGEMLVDEADADAASVDALEAFRQRVAARTRSWLEGMSDEALATPTPFLQYGGREATFAPAYAVLRTQTHVFHHIGQVKVMLRAFGHPVPPGLDFPMRDLP